MKRIIFTVAMSFAAIACSQNNDNEKNASSIADVATIDTIVSPAAGEDAATSATTDDQVAEVTGEKFVTLNGVIVTPPQSRSTVTLTMGGAVENLYIFPGNYVRRGEVIATLRNPEFIQLQQEYLTAMAQVEYLEKEYQRQERLAETEAASQKKLQQSKSEYLSEKSRLDAAKAKLILLNVNTDEIAQSGIKTYLDVKAPIAGYVADMQANAGKYFDAGEPICDIIDKSKSMLQLTAYEKDMAHISVGDKVDFTVNGIVDKLYQAEITAIEQMVDSDNRSINLYARIKNVDNSFKQGMYVSAKIGKNM